MIIESGSLLRLLRGDMRLAQVELAFDPAPRLVLELAGSEKLVDVLAFGVDQEPLNVIVQLAVLSVAGAVVAFISVVDVPQPVPVLGAQRLNDIVREIALG